MTIIKGHYDDIHWTECNISHYSLDEEKREIVIFIADSLEVYPPHPLAESFTDNDKCKIIIMGVISSQQKLDEYLGDPQDSDCGFKPCQYSTHNFPADNDTTYHDYSVEGVLVDSPGTSKAWFSWDIIAREFYFDDLK